MSIGNNLTISRKAMATKDYSYHKRFKFADNQSEYVFQLKRRNWKWLWLLLLPLLLLLLVRCEKDIKVHAVDNLSGENIPDVEVTLAYTAHYLYKNGSLFYEENIVRSLRTDSLGCGRFSDLPCSVFSYIFYALSKATYEVADQCHLLKSNLELSLFHYTWHKPLDMLPKTVDLPLIVMDRETKEPLPGAHLEYEYVIGGENHLDSVITTANGKCSLKAVPECGQIVFNKVSCYGYADTVDIKMNVSMALARTDSSQILLTPLKQRFTYFVKNKFTRQPVPGATVEVVLTSSNGKIIRGESVTNVNGKGLGVYEDAFVLAEVDLKAYKKHYKEGKLDKIYKVEQFAALPEEGRTVYIEPLPYLEQFQNVDSITGVPLASVANDIHIASINGQDEKSLEISNRNGVFYVKAMEGDEINIHSELPPLYKPQDTHIEKFSTGKIIKMEPVKTDLKFRTIDGDLNELLPQCTLSISTSCSNVQEPQSSGNGEFVVEDIFLTEDTIINNDYDELQTLEPLHEFLELATKDHFDSRPDIGKCYLLLNELIEANKDTEKIKEYNLIALDKKIQITSRPDGYKYLEVFTIATNINLLSSMFYIYLPQYSIKILINDCQVINKDLMIIAKNNRKNYHIDFEKINSEFNAYFIGLMITDGYIIDENRFGIDLTDKDCIEFISKITIISDYSER